MKVVGIIQARVGSNRLPGKVLRDLAGEPVLARVVHRLQRVPSVHEVVVATTTEAGDDEIAGLCTTRGWICFRGSEGDVLDRYYQAARAHSAEVVVRVTSDCPLLDPEVSDMIVRRFLDGDRIDYCSNKIPQSFPRGLDTEVFTFSALEQAWREAARPYERVHVTPYFYGHPELFRLLSVRDEVDRADWRWTVDAPEDLEFVRTIYRELSPYDFSWKDVIALLETRPELRQTNAHIRQKAIEEC